MGLTYTDVAVAKEKSSDFGTRSANPDVRKSKIDQLENIGIHVKYFRKSGTFSRTPETIFQKQYQTRESLPYSSFQKESAKKEFFEVKQKWVGFVTKIDADHFSARLVDETSNQPDISADILREDVDAEDLPLLIENAIFYFSIGYLNRPSGRIRASLIRFKRDPEWTEEELAKARKRAEVIANELGWAEQ